MSGSADVWPGCLTMAVDVGHCIVPKMQQWAGLTRLQGAAGA